MRFSHLIYASRDRRVLIARSIAFAICVATLSVFIANASAFGPYDSTFDLTETGLADSRFRYTEAVERGGLFAEYLDDAANVEQEDANEPEAELSPEAFSRFSGFSSAALHSDDELLETFAERPTTGSAQGYFNGSSFGVSQDVVIRGSVDLPSINSIQFWGNGYVGYGHVTPKGYDGRILGNNSGGVLGLNLPLGFATISGYYNYHRNRSKFGGRGIQQEDDGFGAAVYLNIGGFYMTSAYAYGDDGYAACDLNGKLARQYYTGCQNIGFFETGYEMATLGMFVLKPFGSYQYTNLQHTAFDANTLERRDGKKKYNSCLMTLGSRVILNLAGLDVFTMEGRMGWVTQLRKHDESIQTFCYGRVPGTFGLAQPYFQGNGAGSDHFWGGLGLRLSLFGSLSVSADYDCLVNKYQTLNEGSLSLLFGF